MQKHARFFLTLFITGISTAVFAQDKIFKTDGDTLFGKVVEVWENHIKFQSRDNPSGPYYVIRSSKVDSIAYANGHVDETARLFYLRRQSNHLKTNNTFSFDLLGPVHTSVTHWYERRVWNNRIGIRIPLYICYGQNYSPGFRGMRVGRRYVEVTEGFAFATGINPKFYFNKHKVIRAFAGPEADIGYTRDYKFSIGYNNRRYSGDPGTGNVQLAGMAGININPIARFNITVEGGAGYTFAFAKDFRQQNPIWRIGVSFGGNF